MPSRPIAAAFALGGAAFFLLCGYEFARSVSYSLFIHAYGPHRLPWVMALSPVGTFGFVYGYGRLLTRLGARRTLIASSLLSGGGMLLCYALITANFTWAIAAFYVLRESYIVLLIEQYWSFINSTLTPDQARRWNGPILGIGSIGGILGGVMVSLSAEQVGTEQLILLGAAAMVPAAALGALAFRLGGEPRATTKPPRDAGRDTAGDPHPARELLRGHMGSLGLEMFRRHRVLPYLAFIIVASQTVATVLDVRLNILVDEEIPDKDQLTAFFGSLWSSINAGAFVLQFLVAPFLLRRVSLLVVLAAIPAIHLVSCTVLLVHPTLATAIAAFAIFKCLDYSIFRAGKEILYIPLPFAARYRAKQVIDAFGYRASKGGTATLLAAAGAAFGQLAGISYVLVAAAAALAWLGAIWRMAPSFRKG
jgi:AAA family ATP:ADP antiporter